MAMTVEEGQDLPLQSEAPQPKAVQSDLQQFYAGATVFITGGTGFLGKLTIEKLLRTCQDVKTIHLMIRPKKGKDVEKRLDEIFENVIFDRLKKEHPKFLSKIALMAGDCSEPDLGLKPEDRQKIIEEVNCIIHCAATVRFDEKMRSAVNINIRAPRDLLKIAHEMKQLKSFVYVSTAFGYCPQQEIDETFYDSSLIAGSKLISVVDALDDETLNAVTPTLIGKWPNSYAFTKAIAEGVVRSEGEGLPVAVVRPGIVMGTAKEPIPGWIDNFYGAAGILVGVALGLIRTLNGDADKLADIVPADYVVNCILAAAWDIGRNGNLENSSQENEIKIFNYVSSPEKPITWREFTRLSEIHAKKVPSPLLVWHYCFVMTKNKFFHQLCIFFLHQVPAYLVDFVAYCIGKKPLLVNGYKKINKFTEVIAYFATREWRFHNNNTQALWKKLSAEDKKLFDFDMGSLDWDAYFETGTKGGRVYLLKDPLETLPAGKVRYRKLMVAHYGLCAVLCYLLFLLISFVFRQFL